MFHAFIAFAGRKLHVRDFDVVLIVEPHLGPQAGACALRHHPDRFHCISDGVRNHRRCRFLRLAPGGLDRGQTGGMGIGQHCHIVQRAIGCPGGDHHRTAVMGQGRAVGIGAEADPGGIPGQLAATMAPQMHDRRPAARHGNGVAGDMLQHGSLTGLQAERDARHPLATLDPGDGAPRLDADAKGAGTRGQRAGQGAAGIHDAGHGQPRLFQRDGGAVGIVILGDDHGAVAG